jgi:hypothetical protein
LRVISDFLRSISHLIKIDHKIEYLCSVDRNKPEQIFPGRLSSSDKDSLRFISFPLISLISLISPPFGLFRMFLYPKVQRTFRRNIMSIAYLCFIIHDLNQSNLDFTCKTRNGTIMSEIKVVLMINKPKMFIWRWYYDRLRVLYIYIWSAKKIGDRNFVPDSRDARGGLSCQEFILLEVMNQIRDCIW